MHCERYCGCKKDGEMCWLGRTDPEWDKAGRTTERLLQYDKELKEQVRLRKAGGKVLVGQMELKGEHTDELWEWLKQRKEQDEKND